MKANFVIKFSLIETLLAVLLLFIGISYVLNPSHFLNKEHIINVGIFYIILGVNFSYTAYNSFKIKKKNNGISNKDTLVSKN